MTTEEDFQAALDAHPDDWQTRLVFAGWLDERGDSRAAGYRALGSLKLVPHKQTRDDYARHQGNWSWIETITGNCHGCKLKSTWHGKLTQVWVDAPPGFHVSWAHWGVRYETRREAEDDAARAFALLTTNQQARLLAGVRS